MQCMHTHTSAAASESSSLRSLSRAFRDEIVETSTAYLCVLVGRQHTQIHAVLLYFVQYARALLLLVGVYRFSGAFERESAASEIALSRATRRTRLDP